MTKRNKIVWIVALVAAICVCATTFAAILFSFRVDGGVKGDTGDVSSSGVVSVEVTDVALNFANQGDSVDVPITVSNAGKANVVYSFGIAATASQGVTLTESQQNRLRSAILTYKNGKFIGTLAQVTANGDLFGGYIMYGNGNKRSQTDKLTFKLHIAADSDVVGKQFDLKITTYVRNTDYSSYIFVADEQDFVQAAADVNGGLLDENKKQTIVLSADVALTKDVTFSNAVDIDLCGRSLTLDGNVTLSGDGEYKIYSSRVCDSVAAGSGAITLNSPKAALNVDEMISSDGQNVGKSYSDKVNAVDFDQEKVLGLLVERFNSVSYGGIAACSSVSAFGALDFYKTKVAVTTDGQCSYSDGTLTTNAVKATTVGQLTVSVGKFESLAEFRIVGDGDGTILAELLNNELSHIPNTTLGDAVTYDIFLPKAVESKNVRIEWTSSAPESVSADGKLAEVLTENTPVTLFAKIYVNDSVFTKSFSFKVTSQTRETKFKYLVAQLSPIRLTKVYDVEKDNKDEAYYRLPVVGGENDYRSKFNMYGDTVQWAGFNDIGLVGLTYAVKSAYNFISLDAYAKAVYLNSATFFTFAQMTITGDFGNGETYTENVNVLIELGDNTELYELVFGYVEKTFGDIDVLQNILDTRSKYGVKYERGDFLLPKQYQGISITYSSASDAVTDILSDDDTDMFRVYLDPQKFTLSESYLGIKVSVQKEGDASGGQSRVLYVTAPAVIKPDDDGFANYSVFSSVKYQTVQAMDYTPLTGVDDRLAKLPDVVVSVEDQSIAVAERTGFVTSGTTVTNNTPNYILAYDAANVSTLTFKIGGDGAVSNSHAKAYRFVRLLQWATGDQTDPLPFSFGSYNSSTKADGKEYLNETEAAVLKAFLTSEVGFDQENELPELWASATTTPSGRLIADYNDVTKVVTDYCKTSTDKFMYFKYTEVMQWALNEKDYDNTSDSIVLGCAPNMGEIKNVNVIMNTSGNSTALDWKSDPTSWRVSNSGGSKYNSVNYKEDYTEYISDAEAQIIMAFWFRIGRKEQNNSNTLGQNFAKAFLAACVQPTFLHEDGAGKLINAVYNKLIGSESGFTVSLQGDGDSSESLVPQVSALDYSTSAINYFVSLKQINVHGEVANNNVVTSAFVTGGSANGFFNRVTKFDADRTTVKLEGIAMRACANGYATFDLTNVSRLSSVTSVDFSYNSGVTSIGDILNLNIQGLTYVDVHKVGVRDKYRNYVLDNIASNSSAQLWCSGSEYERTNYEPTTESTSDELRFLAEITKINSPYLALATKLDAGNGEKVVQWYVNKGNPAYLVDDVGVDEFTTVSIADDMNRRLSNYYACTSDVPEYGLEAGKVYQIVYRSNGYQFDVVGSFDKTADQIPSADQADWSEATSQAFGESQVLSESVGTEPTLETGLTVNTLQNIDGYKSQSTLASQQSTIMIGEKNLSVTVYALYQVTVERPFVTTYRFNVYEGNGIVQNYLTQGKIIKVEYIDGNLSGYIDFTVSETRTYDLYFYKANSNSSNLTHIFSGNQFSYSYWWWQQTDYFANYTYFTYNGTTYTYQENSHPYYDATKNEYASACGSQTYTGSLSGVKQSMEQYLLANYAELDDFNPLTATPQQTRTLSEQYTYVNAIGSSEDVQTATAAAEVVRTSNVLYKYAGASGTSTYYVDGQQVSASYTPNGGYRLRFLSGTEGTGYSWENYSLHETASAINLLAILKEANTHKDDALFGNYYGNYYCYSGADRTIGNVTYKQYSVYRLLFDDNKNSFYFEHDELSQENKQTYTPVSTATALFEHLVKSLNAYTSGSNDDTALKEGAIIYYTGGKDPFYAHGFFELVFNPSTQVYYFKSMGGLGNIELDTSDSNNVTFTVDRVQGQNLSLSGFSKFTNVRYVGSTNESYYSGTGGSEVVEVVARIKQRNGDTYTIFERPFLITVSA